MAYDEGLAQRIRDVLAHERFIDEKKMFGGIAFLVGGHMACGVIKEDLMIRVGPEGYEDALALPHAREMDFTGRPLRGMVYVDGAGLAEDEDLSAWVRRGAAFCRTQPPKGAKKKRPQKTAKTASKKTARTASKKTARTASKKTARTASKKVAKKAAKRMSKKVANKASKKAVKTASKSAPGRG